MIEVIQHGSKRRVTCESCGCIFTYEEEDTATTLTSQITLISQIEWVRFVICPDCGEKVLLKGSGMR